MISKGLAVYFYPDIEMDIIIVGVFENESDITGGLEPLYYTIWDDSSRLDIYDFEQWNEMPTREEIKKYYLST